MATMLTNPTLAEIQDFPCNTDFLVEGVLTQMERGQREVPSYPGSTRTTTINITKLTITPATGVAYEFEGHTYPLQYESNGMLEERTPVEVGETISLIVAMVVGDDMIKRLSSGNNGAYLITPSEEREWAHHAERVEVTSALDRFAASVREADSADPASSARRFTTARTHFAAVRKLKLTMAERTRLAQIVRGMPLNEQPIYDKYGTTRTAMEKAFGTDIEGLNATQYLVFARMVLHGELPNPPRPDRTDQSYLFRLLEEPLFTPEECVELISSTLRTRIAALENTSDEHDAYWDDYYLVECCLRHLSAARHPMAVETFAWMIDYCIERGYFNTRFESWEPSSVPRRFSSFLEIAIDSMVYGARYHDLRAPADFNFSRALAWNRTLAAYRYTDHTAEKLRECFTPLFAAA